MPFDNPGRKSVEKERQLAHSTISPSRESTLVKKVASELGVLHVRGDMKWKSQTFAKIRCNLRYCNAN